MRNDIAVVVPVPKDKRSVFVVPWLPTDDGGFQLTYIGTTDTDYDGPLDEPQCTADDVAYLLRALNASVDEPLTEADVVGTWAGLRPLVKAASSGRTADLSRRHRVTASDSGVITVTGGKLTTYREMAEDTVDEVVATLEPAPLDRAAAAPADCCLRGAQPVDPSAPRDGPPPGRPLRQRGARRAGARRGRPRRWASRWSPGSPTCAPRPSTPPATRWP